MTRGRKWLVVGAAVFALGLAGESAQQFTQPPTATPTTGSGGTPFTTTTAPSPASSTSSKGLGELSAVGSFGGFVLSGVALWRDRKRKQAPA